jgi:twinkle protein
MKIIDIETKESYEFPSKKTEGEEKQPCPKCASSRKKKNAMPFSWNHEKNIGYCQHCETTFGVQKGFSEKTYTAPILSETELNEDFIEWFEGRGISSKTLYDWFITQSKEYIGKTRSKVDCINFNYIRDNELINIKARSMDKGFRFFPGAELTMYGLFLMEFENKETKKKNPLIVVEGEIDALSFWEAGFRAVLSVPNGAKAKHNNLSYLDACIDDLDAFDDIILATDNDLPGVGLRNDLAVRFGVERCRKVNFKEFNDGNEVLQELGVEGLRQIIEDAKPFPIEGVFTSADFSQELDILRKEGLKQAYLLDDEDWDKAISWDLGRLYTFTGIPSSGKSEVVDFIIAKLNAIHGFKAGIYSPENFPIQLHLSKFVSKFTGKAFNEVNDEEYEHV